MQESEQLLRDIRAVMRDTPVTGTDMYRILGRADVRVAILLLKRGALVRSEYQSASRAESAEADTPVAV